MTGDDDLLKSGGQNRLPLAEEQTPAFRTRHRRPRAPGQRHYRQLEGVTLTARHTPGHTRGNHAWIAAIDEGGTAYRVVFLGNTSVNPAPASCAISLSRHHRRLPPFARHARHPRPDIFLAGRDAAEFAAKRNRAATEGVKAWVDPDGYRRRINQREAFEALVTKETTALK